MGTVYVVGGRQRSDSLGEDAWHLHERGLVVRFDDTTRRPAVVMDYQSPPELCAPERPSICFSAGHVVGDRIYLPTKTEVVVATWPGLEFVRRLSHRSFNDVHHARPVDPAEPEGDVWVVNTGLDTLVRLDAEGDVIEHRSLETPPSSDELVDPWHRFDPDVDYRRVHTTKPHAVHANYVFSWRGEPWVVRFKPRDVAPVTNLRASIEVAEVGIHDGTLLGDRLYLTAVDGQLIEVDLAQRRVTNRWSVAAMVGDLRKPGWCRGLALIDGGRRAIIGLSRLRLTKWGQNVGWIQGGVAALRILRSRPASVACFDLERRCLEWDVPLADVDMTTVFSIHVDPG